MAARRILAYAAIYVLWGGSFLAIRVIVAVTPPYFAAAFRFFVAGIILYGYSCLRGMPRLNSRQWRNTAVLGILMFTGTYACLFRAEETLSSSLAAVLTSLIPVWVFLAEWLCLASGRSTAKAWLGIALGIVGVVLIALPSGIGGMVQTKAALILILGTFFWAGASIWSRRLDLPRRLTVSSGLQMAWGGCSLFLLSAASGEFRRLPGLVNRWTWHLTYSFAYLIFAASIVAFTAYVWLIAREPATRVASYAYVNPVFALLIGSLLAHERLSGTQFAGSLLVLAGVFATLAGKRQPRPAPVEAAA